MLEQADATGWMAAYALTMAAIAAVLNRTSRPATDLIVKFLEHFSLIAEAIEEKGLWDEEDGFYYDQLRRPDGSVVPIKVRSMVGVLPLMAFAVVDERGRRPRTDDGQALRAAPRAARRAAAPARARRSRTTAARSSASSASIICCGSSRGCSTRTRSSRRTGCARCRAGTSSTRSSLDMGGYETTIDYEPAESTTAMFGGNSNWRGPIWFPVNYLVVDAVFRYARYFGDELSSSTRPAPGERRTFAEIGEDLRARLISLFLVGEDGRRPCYGWVDKLQNDPAWKDNILFNEYFHGDNGAGLGASHQTGWTGIVADMIRRQRGADVPTLGELLSRLDAPVPE